MKSPIFIFSLPRSGSTLLQRVLMGHTEIASLSEPWLLLPLVYAQKKNGVLAEYSHSLSSNSLEDFIGNLPEGELDYYRAIKIFSNSLYEKHCKNNERYFLDKTPRYYLIIEEINKIYPEAKFIFLFRNPAHTMSSIIETWSNGNLKSLYKFQTDLNTGPVLLSKGYEKLEEKSFALRYEQFVNDPQKYTKQICDYLEIEFDQAMLDDFSKQDTKGRLGDRVGTRKYNSVNTLPINKWHKTFNTPFRKKLLKKYIQGFDQNIYKIQGYDKKEILDEIRSLKTSVNSLNTDCLDYIYSRLVIKFKPNIYLGKATKVWTKNRYLS